MSDSNNCFLTCIQAFVDILAKLCMFLYTFTYASYYYYIFFSFPHLKFLLPGIYVMYSVRWASQVALGVKNLPDKAGSARDMGSIPLSRRYPGGGNGNHSTTPVFLPGESHSQRSLVGYRPWGHKRIGHD